MKLKDVTQNDLQLLEYLRGLVQMYDARMAAKEARTQQIIRDNPTFTQEMVRILADLCDPEGTPSDGEQYGFYLNTYQSEIIRQWYEGKDILVYVLEN